MCGILGIINALRRSNQVPAIQKGLKALYHRGPDDSGYENYSVGNGEVYLAQSRLSIIDLSPLGHQPMHSSDGRYSLVFNGEIYNYIELRVELQAFGHTFKSATDTEVLLTAWQQWGVNCLDRLDGMFSFVVLDRIRKTLHCVRDPFGIKPLYYLAAPDSFCFASELTALGEMLPVQLVLNKNQTIRYLLSGEYDNDSNTFFKDIYQILPGYYLKIVISEDRLLYSENQWFLPDIEELSDISFQQATEELRHLFLQSVKRQLRSDVPLGAALSGGIDSSAIVCAIRHLEPDLPVNTFSYIASGTTVSEEKWIDLVNERAGLIPHKAYLSPEAFSTDLADLIATHGEPFGGLSFYAEFCVYRLAKKNGITVMLDGHGADESLCGYSGYPEYRIRTLVEQKKIFKAIRFARDWSKWPGRGGGDAQKAFILGLLGGSGVSIDRVERLKSIIKFDFLIDSLVVDSNRLADFTKKTEVDYVKGRAISFRMRHQLTQSNCPPQLRGADRSAMRHSIENRVPFLSPSLVSFLLKMPEHYLLSDKGQTKHLFRHAMRGIVPNEILDRRDKIGYATPPGLRIALTPDVQVHLNAGLERIDFLDRSAANKLLCREDPSFVRLDGISWRLFNLLRWAENFNVKTS